MPSGRAAVTSGVGIGPVPNHRRSRQSFDLFADSQFLGRLINKTCTTRAFLTLSSGCSPSRGHGWYLSEYFQYLRHIKAPLGLFPICWFTKHSPHRLHPSLGPWYTASLLCCLSATFSLQFLAFLAVRSLVNNILCKLVQYLIRVKDDIWRQWPQIINTCIFVTEGERGQKRVEGRGEVLPQHPGTANSLAAAAEPH